MLVNAARLLAIMICPCKESSCTNQPCGYTNDILPSLVVNVPPLAAASAAVVGLTALASTVGVGMLVSTVGSAVTCRGGIVGGYCVPPVPVQAEVSIIKKRSTTTV